MRQGLTELLQVRVTPTMMRAIDREAQRRMLTTPNVVRMLLSEQLTSPSDGAQGGNRDANQATT